MPQTPSSSLTVILPWSRWPGFVGSDLMGHQGSAPSDTHWCPSTRATSQMHLASVCEYLRCEHGKAKGDAILDEIDRW